MLINKIDQFSNWSIFLYHEQIEIGAVSGILCCDT